MKSHLAVLSLVVGFALPTLDANAQDTTLAQPFTLEPLAVAPLIPATDAPDTKPTPAAVAEKEDKWVLRVTPYLWLPMMKGTVGVHGRAVNANMNLSDVFSLLLNDFDGAAAVHIEAEYERFGIFGDAMYLALSSGQDIANTGFVANLGMKMFLGELGGFYTVIPAAGPARDGEPTFRVDALAGVRLTWLQAEIGLDPLGSRTHNKDWVDPFIGGRVALNLNEVYSLRLRGDIGGFNISPGNTSKLVWNVVSNVGCRISSCCELEMGYRWLKYNYQDTSNGNPAAPFDFKMLLSGPYFAVTFTF